MAGVSDSNALKAGGFILGSIAIALGVLYVVAGNRLFGDGQLVTVSFPVSADVAGLDVGSPVRVGGRRVGAVASFEYDDAYENLLFKVRVPGDLPVKQDADVAVQSTITGQPMLNFSSFGTGEPAAEDRPILGRAGTLNDVIRSVAQLSPQVREFLDLLGDETLPQTQASLVAVADAADQITALAGKFDKSVGSEQAQDDLRVTLANLRVASERMPELVEKANDLADSAGTVLDDAGVRLTNAGDRLVRVLEASESAAGDIRGVAEDARGATTDVRRLIAGNRGRVNQIVERLGDTARSLDLASQEIRRSPWRLLYRPSGRQRDSLDLYAAARQFAEGANALQDAAVALEGATADAGTDPARVAEILEELSATFERFQVIERELFEELRE